MKQHPKVQTTNDGTLLLNFGQYGQEVEVAAVSGDGRRILTVHDVGKAQVWDAVSGSKVGEIEPDSPLRGSTGTGPTAGTFEVFIESASLNRDGSTALLGLNDGTAGLFRVSDGVRVATLHPPNAKPAAQWGVVRAVGHSPDGSLALVGFPGRAVGVWSEHDGRLVAFLTSKIGSKLVGRPFVRDSLVCTVAASTDNRRVFAGCVDMTAIVWDLQTGEIAFEAIEHAEEILALFDNAEGFGWATTGGSIWCSRDGGGVSRAISSGEHWAEARFHRDKLLTRGFTGAIGCWKLSGQHTPIFEPKEPPTARWSDRAETLAFRDEHGFLYPENGHRLSVSIQGKTTVMERDAQIVAARFSPRDEVVAIEGWKNAVELWSIPDGRLLRTFASPGGVGDFAFSKDGNLIAIGELGKGGGLYPRHVCVYDTASGRQLHRHAEHDWQVSLVAFSPDGLWLASLGHEVLLWELEPRGGGRSRKVVRIEADPVSAGLQFLSDGRLLVVDEGRARVFRGDEEVLSIEAPLGFRACWCVSDDGRTLNVAIGQGVVRFDLETGKPRGTWKAPMPRPEMLPSSVFAQQAGIRVGAALWKTAHGIFLHQSDGPRSWIERLHLSENYEVAVPARDGAAVLRVGSETALLGVVPFEGKLRAGRVIGGEVLLINETGRLFRAKLPTLRPHRKNR